MAAVPTPIRKPTSGTGLLQTRLDLDCAELAFADHVRDLDAGDQDSSAALRQRDQVDVCLFGVESRHPAQ